MPRRAKKLDEVDGELVLSIEKLQEIQDELEKVFICDVQNVAFAFGVSELHSCSMCLINEKTNDKVLEIGQKYNEIRKPVYDKRNDIIKAISEFWLTAFLSHPALGDLLNEED
ncbi:NAP1-related protein 2 [Glycine soja]|uniref:NAP1-related protein 2 n=1 Tax=Glycine soja TaxID=3848 RepID=A0A445H732_GLYSO|nr:NAP1-related protein 2 [Glycine soja]